MRATLCPAPVGLSRVTITSTGAGIFGGRSAATLFPRAAIKVPPVVDPSNENVTAKFSSAASSVIVVIISMVPG